MDAQKLDPYGEFEEGQNLFYIIRKIGMPSRKEDFFILHLKHIM
jgi:hypothetical protein